MARLDLMGSRAIPILDTMKLPKAYLNNHGVRFIFLDTNGKVLIDDPSLYMAGRATLHDQNDKEVYSMFSEEGSTHVRHGKFYFDSDQIVSIA